MLLHREHIKTFSQCPTNKLKFHTPDFILDIHATAKYLGVEENICNPQPNFFPLDGNIYYRQPISFPAQGNIYIRRPTFFPAEEKFCNPQPLSFPCEGNICNRQPTSLSAAGKYLSPANVCPRTLRCWNRPYY
jgi:hypothetical protein